MEDDVTFQTLKSAFKTLTERMEKVVNEKLFNPQSDEFSKHKAIGLAVAKAIKKVVHR